MRSRVAPGPRALAAEIAAPARPPTALVLLPAAESAPSAIARRVRPPRGTVEERRAARHEAQLWRAYRTARRRLANANEPSEASALRDRARNALVEHYQPLVRSIAGALERRLPRSVERGDLETAANVGLMAAVEAFDPSRSVPFELYAEHRLRGALIDELRNLDWLPRPWRARLEARRRTIERLRAELGREPWDEEVAHGLSIPVSEYRQDYGAALVDGPAAPTWGDESSPAGALDGVPDEARESPEERPARDDLLRLVAQKLSVQEYRVVYLKYWEELSLREIGIVLGLSESRVCKIHMALLERLRDRLSGDRG